MAELALGLYEEEGFVMIEVDHEVFILTPEQARSVSQALDVLAEKAQLRKESKWTRKH